MCVCRSKNRGMSRGCSHRGVMFVHDGILPGGPSNPIHTCVHSGPAIMVHQLIAVTLLRVKVLEVKLEAIT